jgi:rRNA maturation protein Nop10
MLQGRGEGDEGGDPLPQFKKLLDAAIRKGVPFTRKMSCPHCGKRLYLTFPPPKTCPACGRPIYTPDDSRRRY